MDQPGTFCVVCGAPLTAASPAGADPATQLLRTPPPQSGWARPYGQWAEPPPAPMPAAPMPAARNRRPLAIGGIVAAVVVLLATATLLILRQRHTDQADTPTPAPEISAAPAQPSPAGSSADSSATSSPAGGLATVVTITSDPDTAATGSTDTSAESTGSTTPTTPPTTAKATATTTPKPDPLGGDRLDISCGTAGFIVQVASEVDQTAFAQRVAQLRAAGELPTGVRYARTATSCPGLFNPDANYFVLYAGPYASAADACPARLSSPDDAFVKSTDPAQKSQVFSCVCSAAAGSMPPIGGVGVHGPWVGELQRLLRNAFDGKYKVDDLDRPGTTSTGTYSAGTAAAVSQFQTDHGLPGTGVVDASTWQQLQSAGC